MREIHTKALAREFGSITAVESLDLEVHEGEIYGFLGPNGAGKSTTINMLLGFTPPPSGSGTVLGHDIEDESLAVRQSIGVLPEDFGMYERLTARKHVQLAVDTKGADDDPDVLLECGGLDDAADRKTGGFSIGMKQRDCERARRHRRRRNRFDGRSNRRRRSVLPRDLVRLGVRRSVDHRPARDRLLPIQSSSVELNPKDD